jgi:hypothetical protein
VSSITPSSIKFNCGYLLCLPAQRSLLKTPICRRKDNARVRVDINGNPLATGHSATARQVKTHPFSGTGMPFVISVTTGETFPVNVVPVAGSVLLPSRIPYIDCCCPSLPSAYGQVLTGSTKTKRLSRATSILGIVVIGCGLPAGSVSTASLQAVDKPPHHASQTRHTLPSRSPA